jgi:hypothetical protein
MKYEDVFGNNPYKYDPKIKAMFIESFGRGPYPCTKAWLVALAAARPDTRDLVAWAISNDIVQPHEVGVVAGADCRGAYLPGVKLRWCKLVGIDLRGADLSYANLHQADLTNADLRGADLTFANLSGALLDGANLEGARFKDTFVGDAYLSTARGLAKDQPGLLHYLSEYHYSIARNLK